MFRAFPSKTIVTQSFSIDVPINRVAALLRIRPKFETFDDTNVKVISVNGYPRSGNTTLSYLLRNAKRADTKLLSHLHDVIDLKMQLDNGATCLVPFRKPIDAIASLAVHRSRENDARAIRSYLKSWIVWHKMCLKLDNYPNIHFVGFDEITRNLSSILSWKSLDTFLDHDYVYDENTFSVYLNRELSTIDGQGYNSDGTPSFRTLSIPDTLRSSLLDELKRRIADDGSLDILKSRANTLYFALVELGRR